jgi:hypothetical protein
MMMVREDDDLGRYDGAVPGQAHFLFYHIHITSRELVELLQSNTFWGLDHPQGYAVLVLYREWFCRVTNSKVV